jgi:hypothetical protein
MGRLFVVSDVQCMLSHDMELNKASVTGPAPLDDEVEPGRRAGSDQGLTKAISQHRPSQQRDYRRIDSTQQPLVYLTHIASRRR